MEVEVVGVSELDPVAQVENLKAFNYRNVKPGTHLAKYLPPVEDLERSKEAVECRSQKMNNPDTPKRLRREIEKLQQNMRQFEHVFNIERL